MTRHGVFITTKAGKQQLTPQRSSALSGKILREFSSFLLLLLNDVEWGDLISVIVCMRKRVGSFQEASSPFSSHHDDDLADWNSIKQRWVARICLRHALSSSHTLQSELECYAHSINLLLLIATRSTTDERCCRRCWTPRQHITFSFSQLLSIKCRLNDSARENNAVVRERMGEKKKGNCCRMKFNFHHFDDVNAGRPEECGGWWGWEEEMIRVNEIWWQSENEVNDAWEVGGKSVKNLVNLFFSGNYRFNRCSRNQNINKSTLIY